MSRRVAKKRQNMWKRTLTREKNQGKKNGQASQFERWNVFVFKILVAHWSVTMKERERWNIRSTILIGLSLKNCWTWIFTTKKTSTTTGITIGSNAGFIIDFNLTITRLEEEEQQKSSMNEWSERKKQQTAADEQSFESPLIDDDENFFSSSFSFVISAVTRVWKKIESMLENIFYSNDLRSWFDHHPDDVLLHDWKQTHKAFLST